MGPNVCSWRTIRVFLLAAAFLAACADSVRSQPLATGEKGQVRAVRMNRVWSLRLSFEMCALDITMARMAQISPEGVLSPWRHINPNLFIIQWSQRLPFEREEIGDATYGLYDLLADYGQTRYVIQLVGNGSESGNIFTKFLWVSPVGLSSQVIPAAPIRKNRSLTEWTDEENQAMAAWFRGHTLVHKNFLREFRMLMHKSDKKLEFVVKIKGGDCEE